MQSSSAAGSQYEAAPGTGDRLTDAKFAVHPHANSFSGNRSSWEQQPLPEQPAPEEQKRVSENVLYQATAEVTHSQSGNVEEPLIERKGAVNPTFMLFGENILQTTECADDKAILLTQEGEDYVSSSEQDTEYMQMVRPDWTGPDESTGYESMAPKSGFAHFALVEPGRFTAIEGMAPHPNDV